MATKYYPEGADLSYVDISHEQERELFKKSRAGDGDAREFLIKNHLLFAAIQGQKWAAGKLPADEVISAANMALMSAIDKFDPARANRFSSYLRKFIRGEIAALWRSKNTVDSPTHPEEGSWSRPLEESLEDEVGEDHPSDGVDHSEFMIRALEQCRSSLPTAEAEVIALHFGENAFTLEEIARLKGLSRQRIFQIKESGLGQLRLTMSRMLTKAGVVR